MYRVPEVTLVQLTHRLPHSIKYKVSLNVHFSSVLGGENPYYTLVLLHMLTLKRPGYFWSSKVGLNQPPLIPVLLYCHFSFKSSTNGLKWELASLYTYRVFENHPIFCSFSARCRRSYLVWPRKFSSFRYDNFWKFIIFDLHGQYVHQMKAEDILNSN